MANFKKYSYNNNQNCFSVIHRLQQQSTMDIQSAEMSANAATASPSVPPTTTVAAGKTSTPSIPMIPVAAANINSTTTNINNLNRKINGFLNLKTPLIG